MRIGRDTRIRIRQVTCSFHLRPIPRRAPRVLKQFGAFTLDTLNECLWRAGVRIALPPKPFAVLRYLVEHPGRLVSHDELLDALWPETYVQPQILRTYMLDLRKVLDDDARNPRFIQSLPKRGYSFVANVTEAAANGELSAAVVPADVRASSECVGRETELASLHAAMHQAARGTRQIVFVTGESGIGKTALIEAFRTQVESSQSAAAAIGQCIRGFAGRQEYYPLADAFRCGSESSHASAICRILHGNAAKPTADSETDPAASPVPGELCAALEDTARDNPLLLILEDLEWSDDSTLAVLSALARRRAHAKLMIVATVAPQTGSKAESIMRLIHDLSLRRLCRRIDLGRLPKASVAALIRVRLQQEAIPEGLHEFVYQQSEGNPRFVLAILEHLIAEKLLARVKDDNNDRWELRSPLEQADAATPGELARMIEMEVEHLSLHEQQLLEAGSLATVAFPAWMVAAALEQDVASTEEACDALARRVSFVKRAGEDELPDGTRSRFYVFAHTMFREVLYQRQSASRRTARHARVADRLRAIFYGRDELIASEAAAHYEAAGAWVNAIAMLRIAARRAMETKAYGEAADLHQRIARLGACVEHNESHPAPNDVCDELMWSHDLDIAHVSRSTIAKA
jgi:predicted ATPase/DNA-binding winged helix-turn-helix (wHTH) protein